jgi:hypothetical protein
LTIDQLAAQLEIAYHADVAVRTESGEGITSAEQVAVNAYLTPLSRRIARAGVRRSRESRRGVRLQARDYVSAVARDAERSIRDDPACGNMIAVVGWIVLEKLLWNLAFRLAQWLVVGDEREDLICRMEGD